MINQRLIALYKISSFSHYAGKEIDYFMENGNVKLKGYDQIYCKPDKIILYEEGVIILRQLDTLKREYDEKIRMTKESYIMAVKMLIKIS